MRTNAELRAIARQSLSGAWGLAALAMLIFMAVSYAIGYFSLLVPVLGFLIPLLLAGPLYYGILAYFLRTVRGERPELPVLFSGFSRLGVTIGLFIIAYVLVALWSILLIIPGIIAQLRYSMAYFILHDHPDMSALEAIRQSKEMMRGRKGKLFLLFLSFIGWIILSVITFGIGFLWLYPYMMTSMAAFYEDLRANRQPAAEAGFAHDPAQPASPI